MSIKLTTFALTAYINSVPENDIIDFFKLSIKCTRQEAMSAIEDAQKILSELQPRVLTVGMIKEIVSEYVEKKIQQDKIENQKWNNSFEQINPSSPLLHIASAIQPDEFVVQATRNYDSRDPVREHSLRVGSLYVITEVRSLNDGTGDAWFCGYVADEPEDERNKKWIFSDFCKTVFS